MSIQFLDDGIKKVHFIGVGGVSMSSLAELLHINGYKVSGSDIRSSKYTDHLTSIGIEIFLEQKAENIKSHIDLVVYTVAVKDNNPEMMETKNKNIKIIDRAELLGTILKSYDYPICVAGVHGKTTTTSMFTQVLLEAELDPTISIGGYFKPIGGNFKIGNSEYFVVEACEYYDSFLKFFPYIGIILNIEADHLDYFSGIEQIEDSFNQFAKNIPSNGTLVVNGTVDNLDKILKNVDANIITFGNEDSIVQAKNVKYNKFGHGIFDLYDDNKLISKVNMSVPGYHNIMNALSVYSSCKVLDINVDIVIRGLEKFSGSERRFEIKGSYNDIKVIDDYAHHPTEIKTTLHACKQIDDKKIWAVFQPHTFSRTKLLFNDFVDSFDDADKIIIIDIFPAREIDTGEIHSKDLVKSLVNKGKDAIYINSFEECVEYLWNNCIPNDLLITMGAGDVYLVGEKLLSKSLSTQSTDL